MSLVPQLEDELIAVAKRAAAPAARRRRPRRLPLLAAAGLLALVLGAAALAATGVIGGGAPLEPAPGAPHDPHSGLGVPQPRDVQLLKVAVPDPAGGPPWGLRFVTTTRGVGCLQVGRLVRGDLGVLGQDGAFRNDRRFHRLAETLLGSIAGPFPCGTLDANGHAFAAVYMDGVLASGLIVLSHDQRGCLLRPGRQRGTQPATPACPRGDYRALTVGMAGPQAKSVTYRSGNRLRTIPTVGEQGAYLIVQRRIPDLDNAHGLGSFTPLAGAGGGPIVRVTYRDGSSCQVRPRSANARFCPPVGQVLPSVPTLTRADLAAPVTARVGSGRFGRTVIVSFVARRAVTDASAAYVFTLRFAGPQTNCRATVIGPLLRNVRAGQRVHFRQPTDGCRGIFHGKVAYRYGLQMNWLPGVADGGREVNVGSFSVDAR